jgi:nitric oxide reductase NorE protein
MKELVPGDVLTSQYKNIFYPPGGILIWIIIFLELITFSMGLIALVIFSKEDPDLFHKSRLALNKSIGALNTIVLLSSGFCMAQTVNFIKKENIGKAKYYLKWTMSGGMVFMLFKAIEYYQKLQDGIDLNTNLFYTFYWLLTAFHLVHVAVGLVILIFMYKNIRQAKFNPDDIEAGAAFWHMCDLIWLLLFPVLYLLL